MRSNVLRHQAGAVADVRGAVVGRIAVEDLAIPTGLRHVDAEVVARDRREVADHEHVVERVFGQQLSAAQDVVLVLRTLDIEPKAPTAVPEVPAYFDVLQGLSAQDLVDGNAIIEKPTVLAHPSD